MNEQQTFHINMTNRQLRWERGQHALAPGGLASATRAQRDACDHVRVSRRRGKCVHTTGLGQFSSADRHRIRAHINLRALLLVSCPTYGCPFTECRLIKDPVPRNFLHQYA